jgi:peptidoglycan lytic transglycosylase
VTVRINDRGPFKRHRIIDLSYAAAQEIDAVRPGTATVELYLAAPGAGDELPPPRFTVQVAAFSEQERAEALRRELNPMYPETVVTSDGTWSRVQIGVFASREEADSLRRELAAIGLSAIVVATR